jgi:hypothetical protein
MMDRYFKEKVFLTFAEMQGELFPESEVVDAIRNPLCVECDERAIYRDAEGDYWCQKDVHRAKGEVTTLVLKETPAQAEARLAREAEGRGDQPSVTIKVPKNGMVVMEGGGGGGGSGRKTAETDMSHANRPRGGRTKRKKI